MSRCRHLLIDEAVGHHHFARRGPRARSSYALPSRTGPLQMTIATIVFLVPRPRQSHVNYPFARNHTCGRRNRNYVLGKRLSRRNCPGVIVGLRRWCFEIEHVRDEHGQNATGDANSLFANEIDRHVLNLRAVPVGRRHPQHVVHRLTLNRSRPNKKIHADGASWGIRFRDEISQLRLQGGCSSGCTSVLHDQQIEVHSAGVIRDKCL